jgi:hypothetical protein
MLFLGISPSGLSLLDSSTPQFPVSSAYASSGPSAWFVPSMVTSAAVLPTRSDGGNSDSDGQTSVDPLFALAQQYTKDKAVAAQAKLQLSAEGLLHALATVGQALNGYTPQQQQQQQHEDSFTTSGLSVVGPLNLAQWNRMNFSLSLLRMPANARAVDLTLLLSRRVHSQRRSGWSWRN